MMMPKIIKDVLTNADGITYCHARLSGAISTLIYWGMAIGNFIVNHHFDPVAFATGYAAIIVAICGGAYIKKDTERT